LRVPTIRASTVGVNQRPYFDTVCRLGGRATDTGRFEKGLQNEFLWSQKCCLPIMQLDTRIANRGILTIEIISWAAIIIVMAMILSVIGMGICETLVTTR